jgi:hypothetical protein
MTRNTLVKPVEDRSLARLKYKWHDSIRMDVEKVGCARWEMNGTGSELSLVSFILISGV